MDAVDYIGKKAAVLSLVELGLGTLIHSLRIPLGGNFLSLYQTYYLTKISIESKPLKIEKRSPYLVSNIAAVLKSLSPAGNKLGPMLSISLQGLLYSFGLAVFGANFAGRLFGGILSGLWAFIQPFLTYLVFFGANLLLAADYFLKKTIPFQSSSLGILVMVIIGVKVLLSALAVFLASQFGNDQRMTSFEEKMVSKGLAIVTKNGQISSGESREAAQRQNPFRGALGDLTRPLFVLSFAMTGAFFYYSQKDATHILLYLLRPLAVAFVFFYFSRSMMIIRLLRKLEGTSLAPWGQSLRIALEQVRSQMSLGT